MLSLRRVGAIALLVFLNLTKVFAATSPLEVLISDMQQYRTTNARFHAGHVFEHSVWVSRASINLLNSEWKTKCDCRESIRNVILAAILHDIGKCGDLVLEFNEKPGHPLQGFEYLTGRKEYKLVDGRVFDFAGLYTYLGLSNDDVAFMAIVAGMHHDLGGLMRGLNALDQDCFGKTLGKLDKYIHDSGYMGGSLEHGSKEYRKLVKYICLISAADVISAQVVPFCENHLIIDDLTNITFSRYANVRCQSLSDGLNGYKFFNYDVIGIKARTCWLSLCV